MKKILFLMLILASFLNGQGTSGWDTPYNTVANYRSSSIVVYDATTGKYYNPSIDSNGVLTVNLNNGGGIVDTTNNALKTIGLNNVQYHYTAPIDVLNFTNLDTDSTQIVVELASYRHFSLHVLASGGVTYKVWVSNIASASATDPYDGNWIDYSTALLGGATVVDTDGFYIQDTVLPALKIMIKAVTSDATNAFSATIIKSF